LWNSNEGPSQFNGPVTFQDRAHHFDMNQLYIVSEKVLDTSDCCWDVGGRIDVLYGSDARFTKALGWELNPAGGDDWNDDGERYQIAIPQLYGEVGYGDLSFKVGHFYTVLGYEVVPATGNFFYTHSYVMQYGEPFTHFGGLLTWKANDSVSLYGGIVNGWDALDRVNDNASFLGGLTYTPECADWTLALAGITGEEDNLDGRLTHRALYSLVFTYNITDDWQYVLQNDVGWQQSIEDVTGQDAEWYGVNNYLFYTINKCWRAGGRFEWFRDDDGVRVTGIDIDNPYDGGSPGDFYEVALGLNWSPTANILVRPEVRWDWYDGIGALPFGDETDDEQFVGGFDAIVKF
jgi:hypothetical protein